MAAVETEPRTVRTILDEVLQGERLSDEDAVTLLRSRDLVSVGRAADELRARRTNADEVTFIVDRNLNYTNVCVTDCDFCAFYRRPGDEREGYVLPKPIIFKKIEETLAIGGTAVLMQGGHHPDLKIDWYEDLFRSIKQRFPIHLHCLSAPEVTNIADVSGLTLRDTIARLRDSGLDSIPGGGAEILDDAVRHRISRLKCSVQDWIDVHRTAHQLGMRTPATMMFGCGETLEQLARELPGLLPLVDMRPDLFVDEAPHRSPELLVLRVEEVRTRRAYVCQ